MLRKNLTERLTVTADGILIPNRLWISGKYYIIPNIPNAEAQVNEDNYLTVQFYQGNFSVKRKKCSDSVSVKLEHREGLETGEYVLKPNHETEEAIKQGAFCVVETSVKVKETRQLKEKYFFRLYSRVVSRSITVLSKTYPSIEQLEGIKMSEILAIRGISSDGVYFLHLIFEDMGIRFEEDVFQADAFKTIRENMSDYWISV